jgi:integrase
MAAIFKRCKHTDQARCRCNWVVKWRNPDGRQREKSYPWNQKTLANDLALKVEHDSREGTFIDPALAREKFSDAAAAWLDRLPVAPATRLTYRQAASKHVLPAIGGMQLRQVAQDRDAVTDLLNVTMAGLSMSSRTRAYSVITGVLDEAVAAGRLPQHRLGGIRLAPSPHQPPRKDFVFPDHHQLENLASELGELSLSVWLMRGAGLRIQEAMAVRREGFRNGGTILRVHEQVQRYGNGTLPLKHRKTGEFRDIPVPGYLWALVKDLPDGYLFRNGNGRFPSYSHYHRSFMAARDKAGIEDGFTPHSLRHAFASALLAAGVPISDVAHHLGHASIDVTFRTYSHLIPTAWSKARGALDAEYTDWSESS